MKHPTVAAILRFMLLVFLGAGSVGAQDTARGLAGLTLEELANIEVTTASRMPLPRSLAPAAVHVITRDQIRRSGATSIPEALRLAPGLHVARIDANKWAIGARGFTDRLARSMLVMIDGRSVYSTLFAGTYWEAQDVFLQDVDRIEVVLGPGGALWGTNAINGIVNVITRDAVETNGIAFTAGAGTALRGLAGFRFGNRAGPNLDYRVYGKLQTRDAGFHLDGADFDGTDGGQAGFRADWLPGSHEATFQGDLYRIDAGGRDFINQFSPPANVAIDGDARLSGGNLRGRWRGPAGDGTFRLQVYYDRQDREEPSFEEIRDTFDVDFQHSLPPVGRQRIVWGGAYRLSTGDTASVPTTLRFVPEDWTDRIASAFIEDEIEVVPDRLSVTAGVRLEHNRYSGLEVQPSLRVIWRPSVRHTLVSSVARAVRTPSRVERDLEITQLLSPATPLFLRVSPNPEFEPEELIAYELGYRVQPSSRLLLSFSSFFNHYRNILSTEASPTFVEDEPPPSHEVLPLRFGNGLEGNTHGFEADAELLLTESWQVSGSYSLLRIQLSRKPGSTDASQEVRGEGLSPTHQTNIRSSWDLPGGLEADWIFRYVSFPSYATSDVRLGWFVSQGVELSVVGKNLHQARHLEFPGGSGGDVEIQRSVFGGIAAEW